jgi:hypothetical protein
MRRALLALCLLAGCGKADTGEAVETDDWKRWRAGHVPINAAFAETVQARIDILPPEGRSKRPDDFCELFVNGTLLPRQRVGKMADGNWPRIELTVTLRTGPNFLDLWDSSSGRNCKEQVDTREGLSLTFQPTPQGYELVQRRTE